MGIPIVLVMVRMEAQAALEGEDAGQVEDYCRWLLYGFLGSSIAMIDRGLFRRALVFWGLMPRDSQGWDDWSRSSVWDSRFQHLLI